VRFYVFYKNSGGFVSTVFESGSDFDTVPSDTWYACGHSASEVGYIPYLLKNKTVPYVSRVVGMSVNTNLLWHTYLLLDAMSPFLDVGGSLTRLGIVVVGRCCSVWYILASPVYLSTLGWIIVHFSKSTVT
jgi:hypothetical protein